MASAEEKAQRLEDAPTGLRDARPEQQFSIVCLSSQRWDTALRTNRQQVMLRAARRGHRALFVETGHLLGKQLWWHLVPNAGDYEHFAEAAERAERLLELVRRKLEADGPKA